MMEAQPMTITLEELWRDKNDGDLVVAAQTLDEYSEAARTIISAELQRRGLAGGNSSAVAKREATIEEELDHHVPRGGTLLARLWHGELSLPITYWLWGVLGNRLVLATATTILSSTHSALVALVCLLCDASYWILIAVAIWRSSARYRRSRVWRDLARVSLGLGILRAVAEIFVY
jgi:hypothetical protein